MHAGGQGQREATANGGGDIPGRCSAFAAKSRGRHAHPGDAQGLPAARYQPAHLMDYVCSISLMALHTIW